MPKTYRGVILPDHKHDNGRNLRGEYRAYVNLGDHGVECVRAHSLDGLRYMIRDTLRRADLTRSTP